MPLSQDWIRKQLASEESRSTKIAPLLDFIPQTSPWLQSPVWLRPLAEAFERAEREPIKLIVSTPPQHGKSTLAFHFLPWVLLQRPAQILFLTYSEKFAISQMRKAKPIAQDAGLAFKADSRGLLEWNTVDGGSLYATGIGGSITGRTGGIIVIDDPIKDWMDAQSKRIREATDDWLQSVVMTRTNPRSSVLLIQTRWHVDDIAARLEARGWQVINLPAMQDDGGVLWPEGRPLEWLESQRQQMTAAKFSALYQGRPRPLGGSVFESPTLTDELPTTGRYSIGIDLAYSSRTSADYSVAVVLCQPPPYTHATVVQMIRRQCSATDFVLSLRSLAAQYPGAPMRWYAAGTEKGAGQFIQQQVPQLAILNASREKLVRAQPLAAAWEHGLVMVPRGASWAPILVDELGAFTGSDDAHDDIVDALAAAWDGLPGAAAGEAATVRHDIRRAVRHLRGAY